MCLLLQRYTFWSNSQLQQLFNALNKDCACYCKDTHFEAIHNLVHVLRPDGDIVLATAKIHILKQFTTELSEIPKSDYCACYCKDTHFEAIHNVRTDALHKNLIVLATAKIHILKQFTTTTEKRSGMLELCLLLQRYTFWSNSQPRNDPSSPWGDCACYCKDTHFEAIHNLRPFVVQSRVLCLLLQRYTFWSNSQLVFSTVHVSVYCACYCKDTHFEAIHNTITS